eukprot:4603471-Pyramimonas_sp.AAC.1
MGASMTSRPAAAPRIGLHPSVSLRCATVHLATHNKESPAVAAVPPGANAVQQTYRGYSTVQKTPARQDCHA